MMEIKIKLFDAKKELPKRSGEYLCFIGGTFWTNMPYSTKYKRFNVYNDDIRSNQAIDVLFWAELPELYEEREDESEETEVQIDFLISELKTLREAYNKLSDDALNDRQSKNKFYEMWRKADERAKQYGGLLYTIYKTIHAKQAELESEYDKNWFRGVKG